MNMTAPMTRIDAMYDHIVEPVLACVQARLVGVRDEFERQLPLLRAAQRQDAYETLLSAASLAVVALLDAGFGEEVRGEALRELYDACGAETVATADVAVNTFFMVLRVANGENQPFDFYGLGDPLDAAMGAQVAIVLCAECLRRTAGSSTPQEAVDRLAERVARSVRR
jgi:hypothetical protein